MVTRKARLMLVLGVFTVLGLVSAQASYVIDGEILLLRSQYLADGEPNIDGLLLEDLWTKAGLVTVNASNRLMDIHFVNDENLLLMAISYPDLISTNSSLGLFIDVDADGVLSTPEDAKIINNNNDGSDYYWDGSGWQEDRGLLPSEDLQYARAQVGELTRYELQLPLQSNDISYDGLQVANPSGHILAFTIELTTGSNETIRFPTSPDNPAGFIDLRLAGVEDQDLPEYQPPTIINTGDTGWPDAPEPPIESVAGLMGFDFSASLIILGSALGTVLFWRTRRTEVR